MSENKYEALRLQNQLCFPLYAAAREVIKLYHPHLEKIGLTYTQYIAMMVLWEKKKVSAKEIGKRLFLDSGTLTPVLKSLEKKELVRRYRCNDDERILLVEITEKGEALQNEALTIPAEMKKCVDLTPQESLELYTLLYKLLETKKED